VASGRNDKCPIGLASIQAGITMAKWFANETDRVHILLGESVQDGNARKLIEMIRDRGRTITVRDLQRSNSRKYPNSAAASAALESLVLAGVAEWLPPPVTPAGGQPARVLRLRLPPEEVEESDTIDTTDTTDTSLSKVHSSANKETPRESIGAASPATTTNTPGVDNNGGDVGTVGTVGTVACSDESIDTPPADVTADTATDASLPCPAPSNQPGNSAIANGSRVPVLVNAEYTLINDHQALRELVQALAGVTLIGVDCETTGLESRKDRVRLLTLATAEKTFLLDLFCLNEADLTALWSELSTKTIVIQNGFFDLSFLSRLGFVPGTVHDTMLLSQLLVAGTSTESNLEAICERHLGLHLDKSYQQADWSGYLTEEMLRYAALDAAVLIPLYGSLIREAQDAGLA
jgi:hypothetical protein